MSWLCPQLTSRSEILKAQIYEWINNNCNSNWGRKHDLMTKEGKQEIYSYWIENSIQSTDQWNGKTSVRLGFQICSIYKFEDIGGCSELKEVKLKKGKTFKQAEKHIASCTGWKLTEKLKIKENIDVHPSTVQWYKPLFVGGCNR